MVEILAILGETHRGKTFLIERSVVTAATKTVRTHFEHRAKCSAVHRSPINASDLADVACQFARGGVALVSSAANSTNLLLRCGVEDSFGEYAHDVFVLQRIAGRGVAADDVIVKRRAEIPILALRQLRDVLAAEQTLLFTGDSQKDDGCRKFVLAEHAGAFQ